MVSRAALLAFAALAVLLVACGGSGEPNTTSQQPEPTARPTRVSTGPTAIVEPRSGPPGTEVTITGSGWPSDVAIDVTGNLPNGINAEPFATAVTDDSGTFTVSFRLEETPDGRDLEVGRYDVMVRSASAEVSAPFLVETRRPIQNSGPGG